MTDNKFYARFDSGVLNGLWMSQFYTEPEKVIPSDAVEITHEQHSDLCMNGTLRRWDGSKIVVYDPPPPAITSEVVNFERQRRIEAGKIIDGMKITGREEDARNLQALFSVAQLRIAGGDTSTTTLFRDGNNVDHELTPGQIVNLFLQSSAFVSDVYAASWALKALDPIPSDFADDSNWPSTGL